LALGLAASLGLALAAVLLFAPGIGLAQPKGTDLADTRPHAHRTGSVNPNAPPITTTASSIPGVGTASVTGSSVSTENCYKAATPQTLCFTVYNGSTDGEWLDRVRLTFPQALGNWVVSCGVQDVADSSGNPVGFACSTSFPYEVLYTDVDSETPDIGEVTAGSSWGFCVNVIVPSGYVGPRIVNWGLSGDQEPGSVPPHDVEGTLEIEQCMPLMLKPATLTTEGCNDIAQAHTFELWNNTGGAGTFNLTYGVPSGDASFTGPSSLSLGADEWITFTVQLRPDLCLDAGDVVTAVLEAQGQGQYDQSEIVHTITDLSGWGGRKDSAVPSMDNVVVWASHADGGLWSIGGYGAAGATQRYDPGTNGWTTHTSEATITPTIEYPMDGCYGLNAAGDEIVVLFPDTIVTGSLHIYSITGDTWYTEPVPAFYPAEGRWGQDVVSLLNVPGVNENACYLSGGSPQEGGGRTRDLWVYYPGTHSGQYLGHFPAALWFNFHASWYVPWVGNGGAICVGGGIDHKSNVISATQCYDLERGRLGDPNPFNALNADLGPLPEPWWGMADGWQTFEGRYQIWIANGVAENGTLLPASAYVDATMPGFAYGPEVPVELYRLEGAAWNGQFYVVGGAQGGFNYSAYNSLLVQCPSCNANYVPLVQREVGP
jgi:hypothetical protein